MVTFPTDTSTLLPVTDKFASADIVTDPVLKFTREPFGNTVALPTVVTLPVSTSNSDPVTEYIDATVVVPVFKFTLDPVKEVTAFATIVGSPVDTLIRLPSGDTITPCPSIIVTLPIVKLSLLPVTAIFALPTRPTVPVDSLILDPLTLTNALGLNPESKKVLLQR